MRAFAFFAAGFARVCQTTTTTTAGVSNTTIVVVVVVVPPRRRRRREEKTHGAHIGKVNGFLIPREDSSRRPIQNLILLFRKSHWMEPPLKKRKTREKVRFGDKKVENEAQLGTQSEKQPS